MAAEKLEPEQIVSLGAWCQATERLKAEGLPVVTSPFDWLVTPLPSLIAMLKDGCAQVGMAATPTHNGLSAVCDRYGALYQHEFPHGDDGRVVIEQPSLDKLRSKLLHKMKRMDEACQAGKRTLFVRFGGHGLPAIAWPYIKENQPLRSRDVWRLWWAIKKRYPRLKFHLLSVTIAETTDVSERFLPPSTTHCRLAWPVHHPADWDGEAPAWQDMLRRSRLFPVRYPEA